MERFLDRGAYKVEAYCLMPNGRRAVRGDSRWDTLKEAKRRAGYLRRKDEDQYQSRRCVYRVRRVKVRRFGK